MSFDQHKVSITGSFEIQESSLEKLQRNKELSIANTFELSKYIYKI